MGLQLTANDNMVPTLDVLNLTHSSSHIALELLDVMEVGHFMFGNTGYFIEQIIAELTMNLKPLQNQLKLMFTYSMICQFVSTVQL